MVHFFSSFFALVILLFRHVFWKILNASSIPKHAWRLSDFAGNSDGIGDKIGIPRWSERFEMGRHPVPGVRVDLWPPMRRTNSK